MGDNLDLPLQLDGTVDNLTTSNEKIQNLQNPGIESLHLPLDTTKPQIRLIYLQPGYETDEITCSLHLADLDDEACRYEALSYEWGDPTNTTLSITLGSVKFPVRENLWWALWHLRDEVKTRILWIDALCINQENASERNHQVQQMGRIYRRADQVVAWIGREHQDYFPGDPTQRREDVEVAANLLEFAYKRYEVVQAYNKRRIGVRVDTKVMPRNPGWKPLVRICTRSYWSRLWIMQELVLASHIVIQCGKVQLKWNALAYVFTEYRRDYRGRVPDLILNIYSELERTLAFKICQYKTFQNKMGRWSGGIFYGENIKGLFLMLNLFGEAKCTKIHDKVFGLLGLSEECCRKQLVIDYSLSPAELGKILLNHQIMGHSVGGCVEVEAWRIRDTFLSLESQPEQSNAFRIPISFEVSPTLEDTTFVSVCCELRGRITSLYGRDAMIRTNEPIPIVPDSTLLREFLRQSAQNTEDNEKTPFITEVGYSCKAHGMLQIGDLVFELNDEEIVVLRQECQQMRVVGFSRDQASRYPRTKTRETSSPALLFLDYPALLTFCELFVHYLSFDSVLQEAKEQKKRIDLFYCPNY